MKRQILMSKRLALMFVMVLIGFSLPGISDGVPEVHIIDPDSPPIYWTDSGTDKIQRTNLDGTSVEDLIPPGLIDPVRIALDVVGGKMYWTDRDTNKIQRANLDGTRVEDLVTARFGLGDPAGIALDVVGGKMYWTDSGTAKIQRANLDGTRVEDLVAGLGDPYGIALDVVAGKMYWTDSGVDKIRRANLDGTSIENLVAGLRDPSGIALDVVGGKMYWTDSGTNKIQRANLDGTNIEDLATHWPAGLRDPVGIALDVAGGKMYWTDQYYDHIRRANLDGTDIENLVTSEFGLTDPSGIALDVVAGKMYWTDDGWRDKIQRANLDGRYVENLVPTGSRDPVGIALDVVGGKMYWTDWYTNKIQRANLDGTRVEDLVTKAGLGDPVGIALDVAGGKMYWADWDTNKIQRANLDGTHVENLVTELGDPFRIALDVAGGKMYWTDVGTDKIQRANLDGTDIQDLLTTGLGNPSGIALDVVGRKMYWADSGTDKIQRANLDGTDIQDLLTTGLGDPYGIALDVVGRKMYWMDFYTGKIQRANLDGTDIQDVVTGLETPRFIALGIPKAVGGSDPQQPDASEVHITMPDTDPVVTTHPLIDASDLHLDGHTGDVRCVAYSPSGVVLASGGTDNTMRLWRTNNGEALSTYEHGGDVNSIAFTANGTYIATGSDDGELRLYKWSATADTWEQDQVFNMPGGPFSNNVKSVAFSHDNTMLACGTSGNSVRIYDYDPNLDEWVYRETFQGHSGSVNSVAFSPGGVVLASASADGTVQLWRARTGELLNTLDGHTADVNSVAFSSDDALIATGSDDDTVILWKWSESDNTWVYDQTLEGHHSGDVRSVAFNPSGTVLVSASADKTIGVWDGRTGAHKTSLTEQHTQHTAGVNSVTFALQGNVLASGSDDDTVRQLTHTESTDIAEQGISLTVPPDLISDVAFAPDATYFILNVQYPTVTGVPIADVNYKKCTITVDIPGVPDKAVRYTDIINNPRLNNPGYYMFPIKSPAYRISEVGEEVISDLLVENVIELAGYIPIIGPFVGPVWKTGEVAWAIHTILQSTADPHVTIGDALDFLQDDSLPILFLITSQVSSVGIKVEQEFSLKSKTNQFWFDPTYTVTYQGTWNLADGTLAAPNAQPMSLADYPPFQLLPVEVQEYLLRHFGAFANTEAWQIPEVTSLLPNYPNPFNPETWIPYQLAKSADVTLTIYDIQGRVVRDLDLGHQRAGMYHTRSRAAYWDGRNAQGEPVASGVYFYALTAGDFTATRKLLIRK